jgi:heme exporter protein A
VVSQALISVHDLWHERADRELFSGLSLELKAGELLHIVGPNGHGKSTLLRILAGLITPDAGQRRWRGQDFNSWKDEAPAPIIWAGERSGWAAHLPVEHTWRYLHALRGQTAPQLGASWLDPDWAQRRFGDLSTGQRKRTQLAMVDASAAAVWLLDEPLSGLDREHSQAWQQRMRHAANQGIAVVVVSHEELTVAIDWQLHWSAEP